VTSIDGDGERMVPQLHAATLMYSEHVTRYLAALPLVAGKRVLDIASGSGYGTNLLAQSAAHVVGVDASQEAVTYATDVYGSDNSEFHVGDATSIPLADRSVDVVVSFETIEHLEDYRAFVAEVDRVLADDGVFLLSTPNDLEFVQDNHFHLHQFTYDELVGLVRPRFAHIEPYFQATWKAVLLAPLSMIDTEGPVDTAVLNLSPLSPEQTLYFYLVCSRSPVVETVEPLLALGGHYSDRVQRVNDLHHQAAVARVVQAEAALREAESALTVLRATHQPASDA